MRPYSYRAAMRASEEDEIDTADIKALAIAVHRLEQAAEKNTQVEEQIRQQERERMKAAAISAVDQAAQAEGGQNMTAERFKQIIRESYGV